MVWLNALLVGFKGTEGMKPEEVPTSQQVAIANLGVGFLLCKLLG